MGAGDALRSLVAMAFWPGTLCFHFWLTFVAFEGQGFSHSVAKQASYLVTLVLVFAFEELMPHNEAWTNVASSKSVGMAMDRKVDHWPFVADWAHGVLGPVVAFEVSRPIMRSAWPTLAGFGLSSAAALPFWLQLLLCLLVSDFGAYWQHRLGHTWAVLWPFHAVHHHTVRLYSVNTVRFHLVDVLIRALMTTGALYFLGFSERSIDVTVVAKAIIGLLSHSNVATNCGVFNYIFNTPENHRWHHSTLVWESNTNYSELFVLWDVVFGTFYHPDRPTPSTMGRARWGDGKDGMKRLPKDLWGQLAMPFVYAASADWTKITATQVESWQT